MPSRLAPPLAAPPLLLQQDHRTSNSSHQHHSHLIPPLAASFSSVFVLIIIAIIYRKLSRNRTAPAPPSDHQNLTKSNKNPLRRFSYSVLRRATCSFASSNRLGQGGFGSVCRGVLPSGESIAVKVMDTAGSLQGEREFQNELSLAGRINSEAVCWSPYLISIIGYSADKRGLRKVLVYELMTNGSLQDKLLDQECEELAEWEKRFKIVLDIAKALHFLHFMCGSTGIVHGDVKPSNVLLDSQFNAKLGDFGLARVLEDSGEDEVRVLIENEVEGVDNVECTAKVNGGGGGEDNGSLVEEMESVTAGYEDCLPVVDRSPESGVEASPEMLTRIEASPSEALDKSSLSESYNTDMVSVESGNRKIEKKKGGSGRDWWWKQDNSGESESGRIKDYVMEWIGNEIKKERPTKSEWAGPSTSGNGDSLSAKIESKRLKKRLDWWASLDEDRLRKKEKVRKPREWWKEEFCEELTKKKKKKVAKSNGGSDLWWQRDEDFAPERKKRKSRSSLGSIDWWLDGLSGEFRSGWRNSQDWASTGDIPKSGGISSTPSMRGTVCYIAPEYGGGGQLSERCDVYSFGVLVLVVISGRRPLQVTASPMSEFERANLVSWARQLAYNGKLLDLVDSSIRSLDREQALLCITIALLCLQRSPSKRPNMKEIVEMLTGEAEPPHLPFEFSPSPPGIFPFKSRKKAR